MQTPELTAYDALMEIQRWTSWPIGKIIKKVYGDKKSSMQVFSKTSDEDLLCDLRAFMGKYLKEDAVEHAFRMFEQEVSYD